MRSSPHIFCCALLLAAVATGDFARTEAGASGSAPTVLLAGARGTVVTVLEGTRTQEIPLRFLGTYEDFAGPGYDLHLVELEGETAERVGVAAGMSGSPVFIEGRLIGALSYRLGLLPKTAVAGVTPFEDMLQSARAPRDLAGPRTDSGLAPIATPVVVVGMSAAVRRWAAPKLAELGFVMAAGGEVGAQAGPPGPLLPGSPVGVQLVRGDMKMAATGTVTWVEDDVVYAFGHPFLGSGRVEMPMVSAEVIHTLADLAGSVKLANVGPELGAVVDDRRAAIVGRLGRQARMIPMEVEVRGADYGGQRYRFELVKNSTLAPLLAGVVVANSLRLNTGYTQDSTMLVRGKIELEGLPDLPLDMAVAGANGSDPSLELATRVFTMLSRLWRNPFREIDVVGLELSIRSRPEVVRYQLDDVHYDRGALDPDEKLKVLCVLRKYRGESVTREIKLDLPADLHSRTGLMLAVGSPEQVDRILGGAQEAKLRSAADAASLVGALAENRSAHRLVAVVYEPRRMVVSRGAAYADLPPTAERLLSTEDSRRSKRARVLSPLSRSEVELDGPIGGGAQVRLRIDRRPEPREDD